MSWSNGAQTNSALVKNLVHTSHLCTPFLITSFHLTDRANYHSPTPRKSTTYEYGPYADSPQSLPCKATISAPFVHALALEAVASAVPGGRCLDVGCGSGIVCGYMSRAGAGYVLGVDVHEELVRLSRENLERDGVVGVDVVVADARHLGERGLFDAIHVGAACESAPYSLISMLSPNGLLVAPVGTPNHQTLTLFRSDGTGVPCHPSPTRFVPLVDTARIDWDKRYRKGWAYGKKPNDLVRRFVSNPSLHPVGNSLVSLGCGQGRNEVYLSASGFQVIGLDTSETGLSKARLLASRIDPCGRGGAGPSPEFVRCDAREYESFGCDGVVEIFMSLPPGERRDLHERVARELKAGGVVVIEGFSRDNEGNLGSQYPVSVADLIEDFRGFEVLHSAEIIRPLLEGSFHRLHRAGVTQFIAKKVIDSAYPGPVLREAVDEVFEMPQDKEGPLLDLGDFYLNNATRILRSSTLHSTRICRYCWFPSCACSALSLSPLPMPLPESKISVTLVVHPCEFMRSSSSAKLLPYVLQRHGIQCEVLFCAGSASMDRLSSSLSKLSTKILYPKEGASEGPPFVDSDSRLHLVVPDGSWAQTDAMMRCLPPFNSCSDNFVSVDSGGYSSKLIESLDAGSVGRITTAEAVGLALPVIQPDVLACIDAMANLFKPQKPKVSNNVAPDVRKRWVELLSPIATSYLPPRGLRTCCVCGARMGTPSRMKSHLSGLQHLNAVVDRADLSLAPYDVWKIHCTNILEATVPDPPDVSISELSR